MTLLYTSRTLVICWGGFGWLLPFGHHLVMQGIHALLAFHLIPDTCKLPMKSEIGTFASLNEDKFRKIVSVLDFPLKFFGGVSAERLERVTPSWVACASVNMWFISVVGFLLPSYGMTWMYPKLSSGARELIRRDGLFLLGLFCILWWFACRIIVRLLTLSEFSA
jgi:hypothetical protein